MKKSKNPIIRRLKIKFVSIMMLIVVLFLLSIFGVQYFSQKKDFQQERERALNNSLRDSYFFTESIIYDDLEEFGLPGDINGNESDAGKKLGKAFGKGDRTATLVVVLTKDGSLIIKKNNIFYLSDEDIEQIVKATYGIEESTVYVSDFELAFKVEESDTGNKLIAFADISTENSILKRTLENAGWISATVIIVMFIIALLLSKWVTDPVEKAWNDQKRFIADASHELKTPLTVIMSSTDMAIKSLKKDEDKNSRNLRRLDNVRFEAERMKELVLELLEVARGDLESKKEKEEIAISEMIEDTVLSWEASFYENKKNIQADIEKDLKIKGDISKIRRLVDILIDNALKYSREKTDILVELKKYKAVGKKEGILIKVEDKGEPISEKDLDHLFDRFYRADASREEIPGYGLGLSIAESTVRSHGGKIWAETDGKDTNRFFVYLPS